MDAAKSKIKLCVDRRHGEVAFLASCLEKVHHVHIEDLGVDDGCRRWHGFEAHTIFRHSNSCAGAENEVSNFLGCWLLVLWQLSMCVACANPNPQGESLKLVVQGGLLHVVTSEVCRAS